jgi:hypothetical protein
VYAPRDVSSGETDAFIGACTDQGRAFVVSRSPGLFRGTVEEVLSVGDVLRRRPLNVRVAIFIEGRFIPPEGAFCAAEVRA